MNQKGQISIGNVLHETSMYLVVFIFLIICILVSGGVFFFRGSIFDSMNVAMILICGGSMFVLVGFILWMAGADFFKEIKKTFRF